MFLRVEGTNYRAGHINLALTFLITIHQSERSTLHQMSGDTLLIQSGTVVMTG